MIFSPYKLGTKLAAGLIGFILIIPVGISVAPRPAHALFGVGDVVFDPGNFVKNTLSAIYEGRLDVYNYVLKPLMRLAARRIVESIVQSTINWANSGFNGSPAFATNISTNLRQLGDGVANEFLHDLGLNGSINSPFRDLVIQGVRISYQRSTSPNFGDRYRYDLNLSCPNDRAFIEGRDFTLGCWMASFRNVVNNPIGAFTLINGELRSRITGAQGNRILELNWGRGVMSWRGPCTQAVDSGSGATRSGDNLQLSDAEKCTQQEVQTPGSVIIDRLDRATNSDLDWLVNANEIDDVVGALLTGLMNKALGGSGLRGLSASGSGGGPSLLTQATQQADQQTANSANGFASTIDGQIGQVQEFKQNWTSIQSAAQQALDACGSNGNTTFIADAQAANTEATAGIARANAAIDALNQAKAAIIASAQPNATTTASQALDQYQQLMGSNTLPTSEEVIRASTQSQDSPNISPTTLITHMHDIARSMCGLFPTI